MKLKDFCSIQSGGTPSRSKPEYWENGSIPWVKISDFSGKYIDKTEERITAAGLSSSSTKLFSKGTLLYTIFATLGEVAVLDIDACTNQAIAGITIESEVVDKEYLYFYLNSLKEHVNNIGRGVAQNNINLSILREMEVPLPPRAEQERIAEILNKVEENINKQKQQLAKLDELVKSRFVEMFGDPETNPYGWTIKKLDAVVSSITAGWSANGEARLKKAGEKAVLKVSAVTQGFFKPDEHKAIPADMEIKKYVYPQKGDLLFSRANTRELVGATAIIEQDYPELLLPDKLWKVLFTNEMDVYYAKHILSTQAIRKVFSSQSTGTSGSMFNVSVEKFRETSIPVPPIILQREFADFVQQTDKSKLVVQQSLEKLETLKKSLMQKYFG